jgi:hypothetical protein
MRIAVLGVILGAAGGALAAQDGGAKKATIAQVGWLAGSWEAPMGSGTFEEHWTKPAGGSLVGMGRLLMTDRTAMIEFMKITETKDGLVMGVTQCQPEPKPEVPFTCTKADKDECVWENPKHDFPTKITYRREKDGAMTARIEGPGGANPVDFRFKAAAK